MSDTFLDLDDLPKPGVVEELSFERLFRQKLETLLALDPSYDALLESDPAIKLLEADAYDEMILRGRINDAARARLLAFAADGDLDQLAAFYGVTRLPGEVDDRLKLRVRLAIKGKSAAGTEAQYRFTAMTVSLDVSDAQVDSPAGGVVRVSVTSSVGDGTPSAELLDVVRSAVTRRDVRAINDTVVVVAAEQVPVDVAGNVWLNMSAQQAVFDGLETALRAEFLAARAMGFNVAPTLITAMIQKQVGIQRVEISSPAAQIAIGNHQIPYLRTVALTLAGRDD